MGVHSLLSHCQISHITATGKVYELWAARGAILFIVWGFFFPAFPNKVALDVTIAMWYGLLQKQKKKSFSKSSSLVCFETRQAFQVGSCLFCSISSWYFINNLEVKFVNDIALVGVGIILENRIRPISGFRIWKDGMIPRRWNQKTNRGVILRKNKSNTKSEYVAKKQTTQSS